MGPVKDKSGVVITNLPSAGAVRFLMKTNATDLDTNALIKKSLISGIVVDYPSVGYISVSILSSDTEELDAGDLEHPIEYFVGCQIEWTPTDVQ